MSKQAAVLAALTVIAQAFQQKADVYGRLDSQDADFKSLKQQADAALAMPDDPAPPTSVEYKAMTKAEIEELTLAIVAGAASAIGVAKGDIVTAIHAEAEQSDVTVLAAVEAARTDILAALPVNE